MMHRIVECIFLLIYASVNCMAFYLLRLFAFVREVNDVPEIMLEELVPLGEHIRQRRIAEHLTQEELGEAVWVTGNTIHRIENAEHATKVITVCRIAKALHTKPVELFSDSSGDVRIPDGRNFFKK